MLRNKFLLIALAAASLAFVIQPASAQALRIWVSGVGDDANPCSRTAPCKTFAGVISKTAPGGEIDALDPGGFGALTITNDGWLIPMLISEMLAGRRPLTTLGTQRWDWRHVDDVARAILAVAATPAAAGVFNLGSGCAVAVKSVVELIRDLAAPGMQLVHGEIPFRPRSSDAQEGEYFAADRGHRLDAADFDRGGNGRDGRVVSRACRMKGDHLLFLRLAQRSRQHHGHSFGLRVGHPDREGHCRGLRLMPLHRNNVALSRAPIDGGEVPLLAIPCGVEIGQPIHPHGGEATVVEAHPLDNLMSLGWHLNPRNPIVHL
jgi:hypothetical protein